MLKQFHCYIKGDVIGVGFRAWTKIQTKITGGVTGWVRNEYHKPETFGPTGGVELLIQGEQEKLETMLELLKKGPPVSHVEDVEILPQEPTEIFEEFEIRK